MAASDHGPNPDVARIRPTEDPRSIEASWLVKLARKLPEPSTAHRRMPAMVETTTGSETAAKIHAVVAG